jgi:hypothetical protein
MQWCSPIIIQQAAFIGKNASDDIATASSFYILGLSFNHMDGMPYGSDFFLACSFKVNI